MIAVMGATGHTGRKISRRLLHAGERVRGLGRSASGLAALERDGAQAAVLDARDPDRLTTAFAGTDAVFTLLPYDPFAPGYAAQQRAFGEAIITAVRHAGVRRVVFLSSVGADAGAETGFIASLHAQEERLHDLHGLDVLILRPGSFFENFMAALPAIESQGIYADAVAPDVRIPMIPTRDIAAVAADALAARDWTGVVVRELLGPCDLSYAEATTLLGAALGRPDLEYVQLPSTEMAAALEHAGFAPDAAGLHVDLARALNDGTIRSREGRPAATTTSTRFEDFAAELARTYQAA